MQQGDPLGPLLFSLAIHPLATKLASLGRSRPGRQLDLVVFYLDDGVLCGSVEAVSEALALLHAEAGALGLQLNLGKCELVVPSGELPANLDSLFPQALLVDPGTGASRVLSDGNFEILGAPVGSPEHCAAHTSARSELSWKSMSVKGASNL